MRIQSWKMLEHPANHLMKKIHVFTETPKKRVYPRKLASFKFHLFVLGSQSQVLEMTMGCVDRKTFIPNTQKKNMKKTHTHTHTHTWTRTECTFVPCHDWNCSILSDEKPTAFSTRKPKKNQTLVDHHVNPKNLQVHMTDQVMLPPLWNSFVGTGIHNGPVPPALCYKFYVY